MYKIALIQNTSQMRSYSFADLRAPLMERGFDVVHFTGENICYLDDFLSQGADCVVFASNALHDYVIKHHVDGEDFCRAFSEYMERGAVLVMHQMKLSKLDGNPMPFLGDSVLRLQSDYHGNDDGRACKGAFIPTKQGEPYFCFPNKVEAESVFRQADENPSFPGDFWQVLRCVDNTWYPIMTGSEGEPLISRMIGKKVIFSSLLLDYQQHYDLLENILINLITSNVTLAVFKDSAKDNLGFSYFLNHLENCKYYVKRYGAEDKATMLTNITCGVHSGVLVGDGMMDCLTDNDKELIDKNGVKLIKLRDKNEDGDDFYEVHSVDKVGCLGFARMELAVQEEFDKAPEQSSFLVRTELLKVITDFSRRGLTSGSYDKDSLCAFLRDVKATVDRSGNGSYDNTFGATCKALWVFYTLLGPTDPYTLAARKYIEDFDVTKSADREKLEKYCMLSLFAEDKAEYLRARCGDLICDVNVGRINEYDMLMLFNVALIMNDADIFERLVVFIEDRVRSTDVSLGAYAASVTASHLVDAYTILSEDKIKHRELCSRIEKLLFVLIKLLPEFATERYRVEERLYAVCALYKFENITAFPVADLAELIFNQGAFPRQMHSSRQALNTFEELRIKRETLESQNEQLKNEVATQNEQLESQSNELKKKENKLSALKKNAKLYKKSFFVCLSLLVVAVYVIIYLLIMLSDTGVPVIRELFKKIVSSWPTLFTVMIVPIVEFIHNRFIKDKDKEKEKEN